MSKKLIIFLSSLVMFFSVSAYYSYVTFQARDHTPELVSLAESKIVIPLSPSKISEKRLNLLLQVQDRNFFDHKGTDFMSGRVTTITQALVKLLYFDPFRPGLAKIKQSLIARFALDALISKEKQLFLFLSLAYFGTVDGQEIRGFAHASQVYFNKGFEDISENEYLSLLAMLSAPKDYNIKYFPEQNQKQVLALKNLINRKSDPAQPPFWSF